MHLRLMSVARFEYLDTSIRAWGYEPYAEMRDDVHRSRAAQVAYRRMIEGSLEEDRLEDMSKDELIRRIRQLNLIAISATNRARMLEENRDSAELYQRSQIDQLVSEKHALQCVSDENCSLRMQIMELQKTLGDALDKDEMHLKLSGLTNDIVVLQGLLRTKQQYIFACETELAALRTRAKKTEQKALQPKVIHFTGFET
jgi:hypothetical protein